MTGHVRGIFKLCVFAFACLLVMPFQAALLLLTKGPVTYVLPSAWHRFICSVFGIHYTIEGKPNRAHQTIYMGNHISYLDIPLLGGLIGAPFVAKSEVEHWPLIGLLAKLQRTAFIKRSRGEAKKQKNSLQARLDQGESMIIFPEGTSTDGRGVLPFKSSLFALALETGHEKIYVQPVTISLIEVNGNTVTTQNDRDLYSWHRDMDTPLALHLWRFAKSKGAELKLTFHPPLKASDFNDRKTLAKTCHDNVSMGLKNSKTA